MSENAGLGQRATSVGKSKNLHWLFAEQFSPGVVVWSQSFALESWSDFFESWVHRGHRHSTEELDHNEHTGARGKSPFYPTYVVAVLDDREQYTELIASFVR